MPELTEEKINRGIRWLERQPDDVELSAFVFVYGTLKQGYGNNSLLRNADFAGEAVTKHAYPMPDLGFGVPFVFPFEGIGHQIHGELFLINDMATMDSLDWLEGHPGGYRRARVPVIQGEHEILAWLYFFPHMMGDLNAIKLTNRFT